MQVLAILEEYYVNGDIQDAATTLQASLGCACDLLMVHLSSSLGLILLLYAHGHVVCLLLPQF